MASAANALQSPQSTRVRARNGLLLLLSLLPSARGENETSRLGRLTPRRGKHRRPALPRWAEDTTMMLLGARRSSWKPRRHMLPCNASRFTDHPRVSALIQTFGDGANARQLAQRLRLIPDVEIIVNDDSRQDHPEWLRWLRGANDVVISSANVHEIRAYHRMARMARGEYLLFLQGDHCLPAAGSTWIRQALQLFEQFPALGLLGGQLGFDQVPSRKIAERISWGTGPSAPIPSAAAEGVPFMFVAGVNIGPLLARREAFLRVGGFDESYSCPGAPLMSYNHESGILGSSISRLWFGR